MLEWIENTGESPEDLKIGESILLHLESGHVMIWIEKCMGISIWKKNNQIDDITHWARFNKPELK